VLADILRERFGLPDRLFGALIVFALLNTVLPGLLLRASPPEFASPGIPRTPAEGLPAAAATEVPPVAGGDLAPESPPASPEGA